MPWALRSHMSSYHSFKIPFLCMQARLVLMFDSGLQVLRGSKTSYDVLRDTKTSQFHPIIPDDYPSEKARLGLTLTKIIHCYSYLHECYFNQIMVLPNIQCNTQ